MIAGLPRHRLGGVSGFAIGRDTQECPALDVVHDVLVPESGALDVLVQIPSITREMI